MLLFAPLVAAAQPAAAVDDTIRSAAALRDATCSGEARRGRRFVIVARVTLPCCERCYRSMAVEDSSGAMIVGTDRIKPAFAPEAGDLLSIKGVICDDAYGTPRASCLSVDVLGKGSPAPLSEMDPSRFASGIYDFRAVHVTGIVADAFTDEIDTDIIFMILNCGGRQITVITESDGKTPSDCERLIGKRMSAIGVCRLGAYGARTRFGWNIRTIPENIQIVDGSHDDPFDAPLLHDTYSTHPEQIATPERRRIMGRVLATWHGGRMLVRTKSGQLSRVSVVSGGLPAVGATIEAVGFPETDLYSVNLARCFWHPCRLDMPADDSPTRVSVNQLLLDATGRHRYNPSFHGRRVVLSGHVRGIPSSDGTHVKMLIEGDGGIIPAYVRSSAGDGPPPESGSLVEVNGTCVMDAETWSPYTFIPGIREMLVSVPSSTGVRVLASPPWWTPVKLLSVIGGLVVVICGAVLWSISLRRTVAHKSKALEAEIAARLESDLKMRERTRLAVELHDSLAQTLSGMAMEIGSAIRFAEEDHRLTLAHLDIAEKTLRSCRNDLRDCLWDLRSKALEAGDMDESIRTTLKPFVNDVNLHIRFNVPRRRLSDNIAHALMKIIRELTSNAIKHGNADTIRIAGSIDGRRLLFSVSDNGSGFDPDQCPGMAQGHFGLQGIRERINRFNGTMNISSTAGGGTKITISMNVSLPEEEDRADL